VHANPLAPKYSNPANPRNAQKLFSMLKTTSSPEMMKRMRGKRRGELMMIVARLFMVTFLI